MIWMTFTVKISTSGHQQHLKIKSKKVLSIWTICHVSKKKKKKELSALWCITKPHMTTLSDLSQREGAGQIRSDSHWSCATNKMTKTRSVKNVRWSKSIFHNINAVQVVLGSNQRCTTSWKWHNILHIESGANKYLDCHSSHRRYGVWTSYS